MPFIVAWSFQRIFTTGIHSRVFGSVKPSAPGWRYLDDSRGLKLLKCLSIVLTFKIFAWYTQYFRWQIFPPLQANAFLSKPHILNVFRSGHKSWMFVTEAVSGMMGFYPLEDPIQWFFVICLWFSILRCFMLRCHGLQAWRQWPLPTGRRSPRTLRHVPSLNKQCLG